MEPSLPTPDQLRALSAGEAKATASLAGEWGPQVLRWAARLSGPEIDPEDVAQEVMLTVLEKADTIRDPRAFPGWLLTVTRREIGRRRRRAWLRRWVPGLSVDDFSRPGHLRVEASDTTRRVQAALSDLPEDLRVILVLCDLEERTDKEVAELMELPLGTTKSRLRRARLKFRQSAERRGLQWEEPDDRDALGGAS